MAAQTVYVAGKRVRLAASKMIGQGGEAEVYEISRGRALKLFKGPDHPEYAGDRAAQTAASRRLELQQTKLRAFPTNLPAVVIAPEQLAFDRGGTRILGYSMRRIDGAMPLHRFASRAIRRHGIDDRQVIRILLALHEAIVDVHACGVTIGDFNDLNVLVSGTQVSLIDADSFQFAGYACPVVSERFVDPLRCELRNDVWTPVSPASHASDWYAFAVMAMQSLLWVGPYGGIYRPQDPAERCPPSLRPARRLTVFHPDVRYPRPARPWSVLPEELSRILRAWFIDDARGIFPKQLLEQLAWETCKTCRIVHARATCPVCQPAQVRRQATVRTGHVRTHTRYQTHGIIVHTQVVGGKLCFVAHADGEFVRETGLVVMRGNLLANMAVALTAGCTWVSLARHPQGAHPEHDGPRASRWLRPAHPQSSLGTTGGRFGPGLVTLRDAVYTCESGELWRRDLPPHGVSDLATREHVGSVVDGQTCLFAGGRRGLALYRVGALRGGLLFAEGRSGITEIEGLRPTRGQLLQVHVAFGQQHTWLLSAWANAGTVTHTCELIDARGRVVAHTSSRAGDGTWLGTLGGQAAAADVLFAPTDAGLVRVNTSLQVDRTFPQTAPWVDCAAVLHVSSAGLHVVTPQTIVDLQLQPSR